MDTLGEPLAQTNTMFSRMSQLLDLKLDSERDLVRVVAKGISTHTYRRVAAKLKFPAVLVAPKSTVRRRLASNSRFTVAESESVVRLARVFAEAAELFGNDDAALT